MLKQRSYLIMQMGRALAIVESTDEEKALNRAKGLGNVLNFSPSLPMTATFVSELPEGVPSFKSEYFALMGFRE
jgi:hypothetical protein